MNAKIISSIKYYVMTVMLTLEKPTWRNIKKLTFKLIMKTQKTDKFRFRDNCILCIRKLNEVHELTPTQKQSFKKILSVCVKMPSYIFHDINDVDEVSKYDSGMILADEIPLFEPACRNTDSKLFEILLFREV